MLRTCAISKLHRQRAGLGSTVNFALRDLLLWGLAALLAPSISIGQSNERDSLPDYAELESLYRSGNYGEALKEAAFAREKQSWNESWWRIEALTLMKVGRYDEAHQLLTEGLNTRYFGIRLRLIAREAALFANDLGAAENIMRGIDDYLRRRGRYTYDPDSLVAIGEAAILLGVEPRIVLENFYKRAQTESDPPASAFLATGKLALSKSDFNLASKNFQSGLEKFPNDPDLWYGLASSFIEGNRAELLQYAENALAINEKHPEARTLIAQHLIDGEAYDEAIEQLDIALEVNPLHPQALSLKAAIAYLRSNNDEGAQLRAQALSSWSANPEVDHLIGRNLSRKYLFKEGAASQRLSLAYQPDYLPAKIQLAQDLLRLAREEEGWKLAYEVYEADPYNISAYNLVTLRDKLDEFETLETENFRIRISKKEAPVYGQRAIDLLEPAYRYLTKRYDVEIAEKVTVEIYPNPADFEVRTFGMPGNPGYLGVCFGPVFTINSPATSLANWESVLYHEFCHTITLTLTHNRMPRWLSEGISVYEEREHDSSWGQMMTVGYRDRILSGRMQKISEMSAAFMSAQSGEDTQFAYYQSYLVVKFLFENYGIESMRELLRDLGEGVTMNDALASRVAPLDELDERFLAAASREANALGGAYALTKPEGLIDESIELVTSRKNYFQEMESIQPLVEAEDWETARQKLEDIIAQSGYIPGEKNAHGLLAYVYEQLGELEKERLTLETIASSEAHRLDPIQRLLTIALEQDDPPNVVQWAKAWIAIKPMAIEPWRALFATHARFQYRDDAIAAGETLLNLDPPEIAQVQYTLALQYLRSDPETARRHTLMALEEAPRFRSAYELLDEINRKRESAEMSKATSASVPTPNLEGLPF